MGIHEAKSNWDDLDLPLIMKMGHVITTLRISSFKAYELIHDKELPLPHYRIGRSVRIRREDFFEWLDKKLAQEEAHKQRMRITDRNWVSSNRTAMDEPDYDLEDHMDLSGL